VAVSVVVSLVGFGGDSHDQTALFGVFLGFLEPFPAFPSDHPTMPPIGKMNLIDISMHV
jgi:hypothetical protein